VPLTDTFRRGSRRLSEPQILFPLIGMLVLAVIWGTTFGIIRAENSAAERAAAASTRALLGTYEAHEISSFVSESGT
jgi:hypothetical protein